MSNKTIGERIRTFREDKGLELDEISSQINMSPTILSQIENQVESPSLGTLIKISKALEVNLSELLGEEQSQAFTIVRKNEADKVSRHSTGDGINPGYSYDSLGTGLADRKMEPFIASIEPSSTKESPSVHSGEEFIYVMEGEMEITLGELRDILTVGDSIYYKASIPHLVKAKGDKVLKILAVLYGND